MWMRCRGGDVSIKIAEGADLLYPVVGEIIDFHKLKADAHRGKMSACDFAQVRKIQEKGKEKEQATSISYSNDRPNENPTHRKPGASNMPTQTVMPPKPKKPKSPVLGVSNPTEQQRTQNQDSWHERPKINGHEKGCC